MNIGIPNESAKSETRVALTPSSVATLVRGGHEVFVEAGAGMRSRFSDESYLNSGAQIVYSKDEVFRRAELICGVAPLTIGELSLLEEGQTTFTFINLPVARPQFIAKMLESRINSIGYELIENADGERPVLHAMSEIAGQLTIFIAARYLETGGHGRGIILGGTAGIAPAAVVVIGAGVVGTEAARTAASLGAQVIVLDRDLERLRNIDRLLQKRVSTALATDVNIAKSVAYADVVIGAILLKGEKAPHVVTEEMIKRMKPGAVIIDVSIDQGGCFETSRPTTLDDPVFVVHDVIHYCVPNITASVARTAAYALSNTVLPYISEIAEKGITTALKEDKSLSRGVCAYNGNCTQEIVTKIFGMEHTPIENLLK